MDTKGTKKFLTSKEAADYIGISEGELQCLVDKGSIPVYKIGGIYIRFKTDELELYLRKKGRRFYAPHTSPFLDKIKDFFYFNDFYILSFALIAIMLYYFFK